MSRLWQDLRYALRLLLRQPGISALAIVTIALGVGANTAIFSAVNAVLLRPLPYADPDRLVMIWEKRVTEGVLDNVVAPADYLDWEQRQRAFDAIAAFTTDTVDLTGTGEPARLAAGTVAPPFFDILGVSMALGRSFRSEEATMGQPQVVVLTHSLWRDRFRGDRAVVGRAIVLNGVPHEVIGVLPATFEFPNAALELWMPLALRGTAAEASRTNHYLSVYGRLKPGVSFEQARADMDRVSAALEAEFPNTNRHHGAYVSLLRDELQAPVRAGLLALVAAVGLVLLIACVNVASLLLASAATRRREMAVRAAIGAGRGRLVRQALTESLLLALLGGLAGLLVAVWGIGLLGQIAPRDLDVLGASRVRIDLTVLGFTFALSLVTGLIFGVLPAWQLARQDVNEALKEGGRSPAGMSRGLRMTLVTAEIALASLLLVGAGLTLRSFQALLRTDVGVRTDGRLAAFVSLPPARYRTDGQRVAAYDEIERRFATLPGVRAVGGTSHLPLAGQDSRTIVAIEGIDLAADAPPTRAHPRAVTLDYFRTMGIRLMEGRSFAAGDHGESPFVVIVNRTMAERYWPGVSPLGKRVRMGGGKAWREIIGIVSDVKHWGFDRPANPEIYLPQKQMVWDGLTFVLASETDPATLTAAVRAELRAVDPDLTLSDVRTLEAVAAGAVATRRSMMLLLGSFAALALVLAAAGIYAVTTQLVALRTHEISVRISLGALPSAILGLVLREALVQALVGLAIGMTGGVLAMRGFESVLFGVRPTDPVNGLAVAGLLLATAMLACVVPALRAMRVDPVQVLKT
jgi:putative ABC transport system permease protein